MPFRQPTLGASWTHCLKNHKLQFLRSPVRWELGIRLASSSSSLIATLTCVLLVIRRSSILTRRTGRVSIREPTVAASTERRECLGRLGGLLANNGWKQTRIALHSTRAAQAWYVGQTGGIERWSNLVTEIAESVLVSDCADNLPLPNRSSPHDLERVRFAALRLSGGRLDGLAKAVELAQADWRDLLVAADFASDPQAHLRWLPRWFDVDVANRWMAGENLDGVAYALNQPILVQHTFEQPQRGSVISLEGLEPEPKYVVELSSGRDVEIFQRHLAPAE